MVTAKPIKTRNEDSYAGPPPIGIIGGPEGNQ